MSGDSKPTPFTSRESLKSELKFWVCWYNLGIEFEPNFGLKLSINTSDGEIVILKKCEIFEDS